MLCALAAVLLAAELTAGPVVAPAEIVGETHAVRLQVGRSVLLRTKADVHRTAVAAKGIVELSQFTPREISLAGRGPGKTTVTFWFRDPAQPPAIYAIEVVGERPAP